MTERSIFDYDAQSLGLYLQERGYKPYRAKQILKWVHQKYCTNFNEMLDLSKDLRSHLFEEFSFNPLTLGKEQISNDGTIKWLLKTESHSLIEAVYIPEKTRATLCISSQVGCEFTCKFCHTGTQGYERNLSCAEVIGQIFYANLRLRELSRSTGVEKMLVTNVVFMGMGEPLRNLDGVVKAAKILLDDDAYGLSRKKVTVSTSGIIPGIDHLCEHVDVALALSLHACTDQQRNEIMPINKKYPLSDLLQACNRYLDKHDRKSHVTLEYVMLKGVNDSEKDAFRLAKIVNRDLKGRAKVNLIPFNPFPTTHYTCSDKTTIESFSALVQSKGVHTTVRKTRGQDILGACGQLAGDVKDRTRRRAKYLQTLAESS